jgi:hypothetical protein
VRDYKAASSMWDRAGTAVMVLVAAIALPAAIDQHYRLSSQLQLLVHETRKIRNHLSDLAEKPLPLQDTEASTMQQIIDLDNTIVRVEADALLLQSKLLEILASQEHAEVPRKIKHMLASVDVLSQDRAVALLAELESAKASSRDWLSNSSFASPPEGIHNRSEAVAQLEELVAEVERWRSGPAKAPDNDKSKAKGSSSADSTQGRALAQLRQQLNVERAFLSEQVERNKHGAHESKVAKLRAIVDKPEPDTPAEPAGLQDYSGKHGVLVMKEASRKSLKVTDLMNPSGEYGRELDDTPCNDAFGPGLVNKWRDQRQDWCHPPEASIEQELKRIAASTGRKLAGETHITCWRHVQRDHSGADQLCMLQGSVLNLALLADAKATDAVLAKPFSLDPKSQTLNPKP